MDYDFDKAYKLFKQTCSECGITVKEGNGEFLMDGKPFDLMGAIRNACPRKKKIQESSSAAYMELNNI